MSHTTEVIDFRKLSDSEFAILIRCCDPCENCRKMQEEQGAIDLTCKDCHLHWHTMHSSVVNDLGRMSQSINNAQRLAAENHSAALRAKNRLTVLIGSRMEHGG